MVDLTSARQQRDASLGRVAVIGGGVAGCAAAIRLAHRGAEVTLFERATFPREKVCGCCLGAAGLNALDAIGAGQSVRDLGTPTKFFRGYFQVGRRDTNATLKRMTLVPNVDVAIVPGTSLSRATLDTHLIKLAKDAGVDVQQPCEGRIESHDADGVWISPRNPGGKESARSAPGEPTLFDLAIVATGLTGRFQVNAKMELPWVETPHGPMGISAHVAATEVLAHRWPIEDGEIQMHCRDDGYVGVVRLPDGSLDVAAAVRPRKSAGRSGHSVAQCIQNQLVEMLLGSGLFAGQEDRQILNEWVGQTAPWLTTPALRRTRRRGNHRIVAIGDAGGYVEPLTGEGMTWGIESGLAVADCWANFFPANRTAATKLNFGEQWNTQAIRLHAKRRRLCRWVTGLVRYPAARWVARFGLQSANWLATPFTTSLANGPRFESTSGSVSLNVENPNPNRTSSSS